MLPELTFSMLPQGIPKIRLRLPSARQAECLQYHSSVEIIRVHLPGRPVASKWNEGGNAEHLFRAPRSELRIHAAWHP